MKHTKGQWEVKQADSKTVVVCGSMVIASDLYDENASPPIEEIDANANLIASAPDMLKALNDIMCYFSEYEEDYNEILECFEYAREVISKANSSRNLSSEL